MGCRIFTIPATLRALLMSRSSGDVCSRKFLYLCTRRLQYTAMDKTSLHTSLSPLFFNTTHSTRVFVLTTHLRGACNRDPFGCWFLMLFTHQTLFSLSVFTVKVNRVGYFLPLAYPLFVGRNPSRILLTLCIQNNTRNSEWCTGVQDSH